MDGIEVPTAPLVRSQVVMTFMWVVDDHAKFTYGDDSDPSYFSMGKEAWEDMGQPKKITVTIQPGDLLNTSDTLWNGGGLEITY